MSWTELPKVELHLHLEGGAPPDLIRRLAARHHVDVSGIFGEGGGYAYRNFAEFLRVYEAATEVLRRPEDFALLTREVLARSAAQGVVYTEIFLAPDFCGGRALSAWREYLDAIRESAEAAEREHGIAMRAIVTCLRHLGPDAARETARCAAETAGPFVVGFGMAGDESRGRQSDFAYAFDMAREAELGLTTHAGEWRGPESVWDALDGLRVDRIGHGISAAADPALVTRLAESGTPLEVCPGSNVALGACRSWAAHPVERLRAAGVPVTISTDDPPFFGTDMGREYDRLARHFGWDEETFRDAAEVAARAAFCDETTREAVVKRIRT